MADVSESLERMKAEGFDPQLDADVDDESIYVMMTPARLADSNPFGDVECCSVTLTREVNVTQLSDEIRAMAGYEVQLSVIKPQPGTKINGDHPAKLYVHPMVEESVIQKSVADHVPDDLYSLTPDQRMRAELLGKLKRGEELSVTELTQALQLALSGLQ